MPTYNAATAECLVFSYKEGLLSRVAHDLKIQVDRFEVKVDDETKAIEATFEVGSMRVICARKEGRDDSGTLSRGDIKKIQGNITKDVLNAKKQPQVKFVSSSVSEEGDSAKVEGRLTMNGRSKAIRTTATKRDGKWVAKFRLHQPDFGIKPFSAMMGALKVKTDLDVELTIPA